jgi:hypothetical protein
MKKKEIVKQRIKIWSWAPQGARHQDELAADHQSQYKLT